MQFSCCLEEVALFPEPIHSWPALRLLSQIKIVRGVALTLGLEIASYIYWVKAKVNMFYGGHECVSFKAVKFWKSLRNPFPEVSRTKLSC